MCARILLAILVAFIFPRCDRLWPDAYWRSDRYVALAIDALGQMQLAFDKGHASTIGLVGPTVFALGANEHYIVVKQHPATDGFGHYNRSVTNYFIVERTESFDLQEQLKRVSGPLSVQEFQQRSETLTLPAFQKTFRDLQ